MTREAAPKANQKTKASAHAPTPVVPQLVRTRPSEGERLLPTGLWIHESVTPPSIGEAHLQQSADTLTRTAPSSASHASTAAATTKLPGTTEEFRAFVKEKLAKIDAEKSPRKQNLARADLAEGVKYFESTRLAGDAQRSRFFKEYTSMRDANYVSGSHERILGKLDKKDREAFKSALDERRQFVATNEANRATAHAAFAKLPKTSKPADVPLAPASAPAKTTAARAATGREAPAHLNYVIEGKPFKTSLAKAAKDYLIGCGEMTLGVHYAMGDRSYYNATQVEYLNENGSEFLRSFLDHLHENPTKKADFLASIDPDGPHGGITGERLAAYSEKRFHAAMRATKVQHEATEIERRLLEKTEPLSLPVSEAALSLLCEKYGFPSSDADSPELFVHIMNVQDRAIRFLYRTTDADADDRDIHLEGQALRAARQIIFAIVGGSKSASARVPELSELRDLAGQLDSAELRRNISVWRP